MNDLLSLNPRLRTQGPNLANALLIGQQIKERRGQQQFQNQLLQQQSERQQTQFGWKKQDRPLEKRMIALRAALLSPNPKDRQAIFESFGGEGITFSPEAKGMEFRLSDGTEITVPKNAEADVREYIEAGLQDPSWFTDETKANQAAAFLVPKGVTVKRPAPKETKAEKLDLFEEKEKIKAKYKGPTEAQRLTEYQRLRNDVAKKWGFSEFSKLDEDTAQKVEEATVLARQYYEADPKKNMDAAIMRANSEVRGKYEAVDAIPKANKGRWNNIQETQESIKPLLTQGMKTSEVLRLLIGRGWTQEEAIQIIKDAATSIQ